MHERLNLYRAPVPAHETSFASDVRNGLRATPKRLSPRYFYDDLGSALFEAITFLPEYYLTRSETEILERRADEIMAMLDSPVELVEFGSGSARKTRMLIDAALRRQARLDYHPIDISPGALLASATDLIATHDRLHVTAYASDYFEVLASARLRTSQRVLALFLGSNIGNYEPAEAVELLRAMSRSFKLGDALLLGADLKKDAHVLELAYDDPTGVTQAFNKNLLSRINRELHGTFDLAAFSHVAVYDERRGSVDSFLEARSPQSVTIGDLGVEVAFAAGERVHTESSHKFSKTDVAELALRGGFRLIRSWTDEEDRFSVNLLVIA
ncbi:MAG TPA: L-histidine N(alpha)-methyltransferase [Candidatus Acidoferrales bacterium]|nr:L-histidine N(alpha)-methyltransferase [Candidatus Acidoferrales bacterium]